MAKKRKDKEKLKKAKKKLSKKTELKKKKKSKKKQNKKLHYKKLKKNKKNKKKEKLQQTDIAIKEETAMVTSVKAVSDNKTAISNVKDNVTKDDAAVTAQQKETNAVKVESAAELEESISPEQETLNEALTQLGNAFITEHWPKLKSSGDTHPERAYQWPGNTDETIMICVFKGQHVEEVFHRHDFFFLNFAYQGDYGALSYTQDNYIKVKENECYIGQPYTGYALKGDSKEDIIIIGVLIQKEAFFKTFFLFWRQIKGI